MQTSSYPGGLVNFARHVRAAARVGSPAMWPADLTRYCAAVDGGNTGSGADGGFAVPGDFVKDILATMRHAEPVLDHVRTLPTTSAKVYVPTVEHMPWQSGAVTASWLAELEARVASKPKLGMAGVHVDTLVSLVRVSDELLEDAPESGPLISALLAEAAGWRLARAIIAGTGSGHPLGVLSAPATLTVPAESGPQTADTITYANIARMLGAFHSPRLANARWYTSSSSLPQLLTLAFPTSTATPAHTYSGPDEGAPNGRLVGIPVIFTEACEPLGDRGDLILADMSDYLLFLREGTPREDVSMHLEFEHGASAFRLTTRVGGQPWRSKPITLRDGTSRRSTFVTLASR